jgi:hypothetical protein
VTGLLWPGNLIAETRHLNSSRLLLASGNGNSAQF